jgi:hypothetical protein
MEWLIALVVVLAVVWLLSRRRAQRRVAPVPVARQLIPHSYDLENPEHVVRIDEIREAYASLLTHDESEFGNCTFKPASLLPYSRREIAEALSAILDYAEGRIPSEHFDPIIRQPTVVTTLQAALVQLETFLDLPPDEIPRETRANIEFGLRHRGRASEDRE